MAATAPIPDANPPFPQSAPPPKNSPPAPDSPLKNTAAAQLNNQSPPQLTHASPPTCQKTNPTPLRKAPPSADTPAPTKQPAHTSPPLASSSVAKSRPQNPPTSPEKSEIPPRSYAFLSSSLPSCPIFPILTAIPDRKHAENYSPPPPANPRSARNLNAIPHASPNTPPQAHSRFSRLSRIRPSRLRKSPAQVSHLHTKTKNRPILPVAPSVVF